LNSAWDDGTYSFSRDAKELYFASLRPTGHGYFDLWVATRSTRESSWGPPTNLGPAINTSHSDTMPCLSPNGLELIFSSNRTEGKGRTDLWACRRSSKTAEWEAPESLGPKINGRFWEQHATMSADGLSLIFESDRPGCGQCDLWMVRRSRLDEPWSEPENLGPPVNTS
jgi:Tol biopolymer transport system component